MKLKIACVLMICCVVGCATADSERPLTADSRFAAGQMAEAQGNFPWALKQYEEAAKLDPKSATPWMRMGIVYTETQQWDSAVDAWNKYIALTPGAGGYANLGFTLETAQRPSDAAAAYQVGIEKDPASEPCRVNYGLLLARQGNLDAATAQLSAVLKPAEVHYNIASVLESQGKKLGARLEFQKALEADPQLDDARSRLALLNATN